MAGLFLITLFTGLTGCLDEDKISDPPPGQGDQRQIQIMTIDPVDMKTVTADRVRTDDLSKNLIGTYFDTVFGQTKAEVYFNFSVPDEGLSDTFINHVSGSIDSAFLNLPYADNSALIGELNTDQTLHFFELTEELDAQDGEYFSDDEISYDKANPLAQYTGTFKPDKQDFFSIELSQDFLNKFENADPGDLEGTGSLKSFFNGMAAVPQDNFQNNRKGGILSWQLTEGANVVFYHHDGLRDTIRVADNDKRVNTYSLDRSEAFASSKGNANYGFIQPLGGLDLKLSLPDSVQNIVKDGKVSIHRASFNLPIDEAYGETVEPPKTVFLFNQDNEDIRFLDTAQYRSDESRYVFNNPTYVQALLDAYAEGGSSPFSGLTVQIPNNLPLSPNPLLIPKANKNGRGGVKMKLTYSKVSEQ